MTVSGIIEVLVFYGMINVYVREFASSKKPASSCVWLPSRLTYRRIVITNIRNINGFYIIYTYIRIYKPSSLFASLTNIINFLDNNVDNNFPRKLKIP